MVETIAFLPFSLFVSVVLSCQDRCRRFTSLEGKKKRNPLSHKAPTTSFIVLYFILGRNNGGFSGQIIVMNTQE